MTTGSLQPTYFGHVATARDALKLFEACLRGNLNHVPRRPHDRERNQLIKSGSIFIYEENASGIKRWTDGVAWSPSRILGNFLVYRELIKPFPPGEKKRAQKRPKNNRAARASDPYPSQRRTSVDDAYVGAAASRPNDAEGRELERALIGSLVDSYGFKEGGLVKKTMSVNVNGISHHMVSYYNIEDIKQGKLQTPSQDKELDDIEPRQDLTTRQNFRAPLDELDVSVQDPMGTLNPGYPGSYPYDYRNAPIMHQMPTASTHHHHMSLGMYNPPTYSTAPSVSTTYTTVPVSQSYYAPAAMSTPYSQSYMTATHAPPMMPDTYTPHGHGYSHHHRQSYPPPPQLQSRVSSIDSTTSPADSRPSDSDWRGHGQSSSGYSTLTSPISANSSYGPPQTTWQTSTLPPSQQRDDAWAAFAPRPSQPKPSHHMPTHTAAETAWRHIPVS